jgi:hypothetical protein
MLYVLAVFVYVSVFTELSMKTIIGDHTTTVRSNFLQSVQHGRREKCLNLEGH